MSNYLHFEFKKTICDHEEVSSSQSSLIQNSTYHHLRSLGKFASNPKRFMLVCFMIWLLSLANLYGQANCTDVCTTPIPCYDVDLSDSPIFTSQVYVTGSGSCCSTIPVNQNCAQVSIVLNENAEGIQVLFFDGPNQCSINVYEGIDCPTVAEIASGPSVCDPICPTEKVDNVVKILLCKPGNFNEIGFQFNSIAKPQIFPMPSISQSCNVALTAVNINPVTWSSVTDPILSNILSCPSPYTTCGNTINFVYNAQMYGEVTDCDGVVFDYSAMGVANSECSSGILSVTGGITVYPDFDIHIQVSCNANGDAVLNAIPIGNGASCSYVFEWLDLDENIVGTGPTLVVDNDGAQYCVNVRRVVDIDECAVVSKCALAECCKFTFECPTGSSDLGTYNCNQLLSIPALPVLVSEASAAPYAIVFGDNPCGIIRVRAVDSQPINICSSSDQSIQRTVYFYDDANNNNMIDGSEEEFSCVFNFTVIADVTSPVVPLVVPMDVTLDCPNQIPVPINLTAIDNCSGEITVSPMDIFMPLNPDLGCVGQKIMINRRWTFEDACGNISTSNQMITINALLSPEFNENVLPVDITLSCEAPIPTKAILTVTDNCNNILNVMCSEIRTDGNCTNNYTLTRTWSASTCSGLMVSHTQIITITDQTDPVITGTPAATTVSCATDVPLASINAVIATDNCSGTVIIAVNDVTTLGSCDNRFSVTRTWTATDICNNSSTSSQVITVDDQADPSITAGCNTAPQNLACDATLPAAKVIGDFTIADDCAGMVTLHSVLTNPISGTPTNRCSDDVADRTVTRTYTFRDACSNETTCVETFVFALSTDPIIIAPADVTISLNETCQIPSNFDYGTPTVINGTCDVNPIVTAENIEKCFGTTISEPITARPQGHLIPIVVSGYDGVDASDLEKIILSFTVDEGKGLAEFRLRAPDGSEITLVGPQCTGGSCDQTGTFTPTFYTASSGHPAWNNNDNISAGVGDFTPHIGNFSNLTGPLNGTWNIYATKTNGTGNVTFNSACLQPATPCSAAKNLVRVWTVTDNCGNSSQAFQDVSLIDNTAPLSPAAPTDVTVNCPGDIPIAISLTATDNCFGNISVMPEDEFVGDITECNGDKIMINRTWTFTDECDNSSSVSQMITINAVMNPAFNELVLPQDITVDCDAIPSKTILTVNDNCGRVLDVECEETIDIDDVNCSKMIIRIWSAQDCAGNEVSHTQKIIILPATLLTSIQCPVSSFNYNSALSVTLNDFNIINIDNGESDYCRVDYVGTATALDKSDITCSDGGMLVVTYNFTSPCDPNGFIQECSYNVSPGNCMFTVEKTGVFNDENNDTNAQVGESITYTISILNTGSEPVSNIQVTDELITNQMSSNTITFASGDVNTNDILDAGETWIYTATYIITAQDILVGEVENHVIVTGMNPDGEEEENDDFETVDLPLYLLELVKMVVNDPNSFAPGDQVQFIIQVTNKGNLPLYNVVVNDQFNAAELTFEPNSNLASDLGNDNEWIINSPGSISTTIDFIPAGGLGFVFVNFGIPRTFEGDDINNLGLVESFEDMDGNSTSEPGGPVAELPEDNADVIVDQDPAILCEEAVFTTQPMSLDLCSETSGILSVVATGPGLHYQWQVWNGMMFVDILNQNASSLILNNISVSRNRYQVLVFTNFGTIDECFVISDEVTVIKGDTPLACNNLVQVSMDEDCIVEITPDMMLEGQGVSQSCNYVVQVLGANGQPINSSPNVTSANIGQTLQVKVWLGANSCWGTIKIEDKLAPVIRCPEADTIACYDPRTFSLPVATDNCGGNPVVTLLSDNTTDLGCDPRYRARRVIRYQAKDASGNLSAVCERIVFYRRITLADVKFPKNYDSTPGHRPHLECDGGWAWAHQTNASQSNYTNAAGTRITLPTWDRNGNFYPDPEETGAPFVADPNNITNYVLGYKVGTGPSFNASLPQCTSGNLVGYDVATALWQSSCGATTGEMQNFRIDTFYNPIIGNNNICKINTTYSDTKLDICPKSFKVLRAWTVLDWCSGVLSTKYQVIKVVDDEAPVVTCPADLTSSLAPVLVAGIVSADPYTCTGTWAVRPPITISDCNTTTWTVKVKIADDFGNDPGDDVPFLTQDGTATVTGTYPNFVITGLPLGRTWVQYLVTDACGNVGECRTEVDVFDTTPPVPVCDEFTVVTLSNNGRAIVFAETFDDGSHDNCTDVTFDVRRMGTTPWGPFVELTCSDVGREVMVELRVTDEFNNRNTCMVIVTTQDKIPPVITCPASVTINCGADTSATVRGIPVFSAVPLSTPYFTDNCPNPRLSWRNSGAIDNCGQGVITRTFTVTDNGGRTATCSQTITVRNQTPYNGPVLIGNGPVWKNLENKEVTGCMNVDTDPSRTGVPDLGNTTCAQVAYTYEDQVFNFVDDVCFKILRKWTVIDWCKFGPNRNPNGQTYPTVPTSGVNTWTYTQTIKVSETQDPVIQICTKADTDAFGDNCNGFVDLKNAATDCTPADKLKWTYVIDPNNDGIAPFINGSTNDASGTYPVGTHRITWTVEDLCGNESTCTYTFRVLDKKKPTPYCISELTTVIMPTSGNIDIWAKDFDLGSTDNCPTTGCGLWFTFNGARPVASRINQEHYFKGNGQNATIAEYQAGTAQLWRPADCSSAKLYTCDDLGPNTEDMSVWDAAGNTDYCTVTLNVQANGTACSGSRIAGDIGTEANEMVHNVSVVLQNMNSNESKAIVTDAKGHYEFMGMPENAPYKITPEKDIDHLNGVSTLDLVLIQRHILGLSKLNSAYKYLAADINSDKNISASDLVELRKLILGIYTTFPKNTSWRFIDKATNVTDVTKVWDANQYVNIDNFNTSMMQNNFVAIKIGDVNGSAAVNANDPDTDSRSNKMLTLVAKDQNFNTGELVRMDITADNFVNMSGAQWTLSFDASSMEYSKIEAGALKLTNENVNALQSENGKLTFSWNDVNGVSLSKDKVLFTIEFRAITNNTLSKTVELTSEITKAEAYTHDLSEIKVGLSIRSNNIGDEFAVEQNNPNPFTSNTTISFTLPSAGEVSLTIYDITGKVLKTISGQYAKGQNEIAISAEEFSAQGVMFYELESNGLKATKKMIYLNK